jgi:DNA-binding response OmpR family regulator
MVTALSDQAAKMLALSAGAADFFTKPVVRAELCSRVKALLSLPS